VEPGAVVAVSGDPTPRGASDPGSGAAPGDSGSVYHIELRQFPHNLCHFNMASEELDAAVVEPWARDQWIELGERKWSPHQAKLTVLESPPIPVEELSMGRGWRTAQREGRDVTGRVLAAARERMAGGAQPPLGAGQVSGGQVAAGHVSAGQTAVAQGGEARVPVGHVGAETPGPDLLADSLGLELLGALGVDGAPPHSAWALAATRHPDYAASDCLALAERAVASLLRSGLVVVIASQGEGGARRLGEAEARAALLSVESWSGDSAGGVLLRRA
jgi:hypothetical protein